LSCNAQTAYAQQSLSTCGSVNVAVWAFLHIICPRHPCAWEITESRPAMPRHGNLTPAVVLTEPPSLPAAKPSSLGL